VASAGERSAPDLRSRINRLLLTLLVILAIGLSRIVLGVHYLSDVWAGYLVGAGWLIIAISISEWATSGARIDWRGSNTLKRRIVLGLPAVAAIGWYVFYTLQWRPKTSASPPLVLETVNKPVTAFVREKGLAHTETLLGDPLQPLSVALVTPDERTLVKRLEAAGWQPADPPTPGNLLKLLRQGMDYVNTPLAPVFWNGRINDLGFERAAQVDGW